MQSHTGVRVVTEGHARHGQTGHTVTSAHDEAKPETPVTVKFDEDHVEETLTLADLQIL